MAWTSPLLFFPICLRWVQPGGIERGELQSQGFGFSEPFTSTIGSQKPWVSSHGHYGKKDISFCHFQIFPEIRTSFYDSLICFMQFPSLLVSKPINHVVYSSLYPRKIRKKIRDHPVPYIHHVPSINPKHLHGHWPGMEWRFIHIDHP